MYHVAHGKSYRVICSDLSDVLIFSLFDYEQFLNSYGCLRKHKYTSIHYCNVISRRVIIINLVSVSDASTTVSAPKVWNTLPLRIRQSQSLSTLRRHLKTHYFQLAYPAT